MNYQTLTGLFEELEKIAAEPRRDGTAANIASGLAITGGVGVAGRTMAGGMGQSLQKDIAKNRMSTTQAEAEKIRKAMGTTSGVHVIKGGNAGQAVHIPRGGSAPKIFSKMEKMQYNAMGIPEEVVERGMKHGVSVAPGGTGAHIAAHELGHGKFRQGRVGKTLSNLRMPGSLAGGIGASMLAANTDPDSTASKISPLIGAAGSVPILADEGYASVKGYKTMKRMGYNKAALKTGRRQLAKAFGTYGLGVAAPMMAAPLAIRKFKQWRKNQLAKEAE